MADKLKDRLLSERGSIFLILLGTVIFFIIGGIFLIREMILDDNPFNADHYSHFGDIVGGVVGSVWALAGVILFYIALREQRKFFAEQQKDFRTNRESLQQQTKALELQTDEFKNQRQELALTRKVFEEQSEMLQIQQFEGTFFNMLKLFNDLVDGTHGDIRGREGNRIHKDVRGMDFFTKCITQLAKEFVTRLNSDEDNSKLPQLKGDREFAISVYEDFFDRHQSNLGHFLRAFYNIIKFIMSSPLDKDEKQVYISILTAHMSNDEQGLVFYNSLSKYGRTRKNEAKLYHWIEECGILENIYGSCLMDQTHKDFYNATYFRF